MLEQKDLEAIAQLIDARTTQLSQKLDELKETDNLILKEIARVQENLQNKIDRVQKNMEELNQYYRITKLENDNTALLLKMIDELSKRVAELEKKTA